MTTPPAGERVVVRLRSHAVGLLPAACWLLLVSVAAGTGLGWTSRDAGWARWVVVAAAVLLVLRFTVLPFARWWTSTYELTSRRLSLRWGVLSRHGRDLPLGRVTDVALDRSLRQRLVGSGTVTLETAGEEPPLVLASMPQPERLYRALVALVADETRSRRWGHGSLGARQDDLS